MITHLRASYTSFDHWAFAMAISRHARRISIFRRRANLSGANLQLVPVEAGALRLWDQLYFALITRSANGVKP